jgi:hypothetical protein
MFATICLALPTSPLGRYGGALMRPIIPSTRSASSPPSVPSIRPILVSQLSDPESVVLVAEQEATVVATPRCAEPMSWKELRAACGFPTTYRR